MFLRPLYRRPVTDKVTAESIIFITWAFYITIKNNFWVRELLAEPICDLGGSEFLEELFDALLLNEQEGHDNDSFNHFLTEIADSEPEKCKAKLNQLLAQPNFKHKEKATWLLQFCE